MKRIIASTAPLWTRPKAGIKKQPWWLVASKCAESPSWLANEMAKHLILEPNQNINKSPIPSIHGHEAGMRVRWLPGFSSVEIRIEVASFYHTMTMSFRSCVDDLLVPSPQISTIFRHQKQPIFLEGKATCCREAEFEVKKWDFPPIFQDGKFDFFGASPKIEGFLIFQTIAKSHTRWSLCLHQRWRYQATLLSKKYCGF